MTALFPTPPRRRGLTAAVVVALAAGCSASDRSPVVGELRTRNGAPVAGARVTARADKAGVWATGSTDAEGRFALISGESDEGLPPGDYYVIIVESRGDMDNPRPATIHAKYSSPGASGLTIHVDPGKPTELNITLDPP